jgi:hypothetical protein
METKLHSFVPKATAPVLSTVIILFLGACEKAELFTFSSPRRPGGSVSSLEVPEYQPWILIKQILPLRIAIRSCQCPCVVFGRNG